MTRTQLFKSRRFSFWSVCAPLLALSMASSAVAEIYIVRGRGGSVTFTSRRPSEKQFKVFRPTRSPVSYYRSWGAAHWSPRPRKTDFDPIIATCAKDHSLDPAFVKAVVHVESAFNPRARSQKGAMGLMQLMPGTARRFGVSNAYQPEQNVRAGTKYLKWLLDRYSGNERLAAAAYNAGEGAVDQYGGNVPPYSETVAYVRRVFTMRDKYKCFESTGRTAC